MSNFYGAQRGTFEHCKAVRTGTSDSPDLIQGQQCIGVEEGVVGDITTAQIKQPWNRTDKKTSMRTSSNEVLS